MLVFWKVSAMNCVNSEISVIKLNLGELLPKKNLNKYNNEFTYGMSTLLLVFFITLTFYKKIENQRITEHFIIFLDSKCYMNKL